jgi:hypothetical protein
MRNIIGFVSLVWLLGCSTPANTTALPAQQAPPARVAVLPFQVIMANRPLGAERFDGQQMEELTRYMSIALQGLLYRSMRDYTAKKGMAMELQVDEWTNDKLASQQISFATLFASSRKELCGLLGVDAVVGGQFILAEASKESLAEVANPFWSVRMNVHLFNNVTELPIWTFRGNERRTRLDHRLSPDVLMTRGYPAVLLSYEPSILRLVKKFIKDYPFWKKKGE